MILLKDIHKTYYTASPLHVLKGINLQIEQGAFVSIMGASGSGKSTLLNILGVLDTYDQGEYWLDDKLIKNLSEREAAHFRNQYIGFIFQSFNLLNLALPLYYQGVSRKKRNIIAMEYLERVGLADWADHLPNQLSGGQKQRVAIARALIAKPRIILADEPTGALDSKTSLDVINLLHDVSKEGITMIVVTHAQEIADKTESIIQLKDGLIVG